MLSDARTLLGRVLCFLRTRRKRASQRRQAKECSQSHGTLSGCTLSNTPGPPYLSIGPGQSCSHQSTDAKAAFAGSFQYQRVIRASENGHCEREKRTASNPHMVTRFGLIGDAPLAHYEHNFPARSCSSRRDRGPADLGRAAVLPSSIPVAATIRTVSDRADPRGMLCCCSASKGSPSLGCDWRQHVFFGRFERWLVFPWAKEGFAVPAIGGGTAGFRRHRQHGVSAAEADDATDRGGTAG